MSELHKLKCSFKLDKGLLLCITKCQMFPRLIQMLNLLQGLETSWRHPGQMLTCLLEACSQISESLIYSDTFRYWIWMFLCGSPLIWMSVMLHVRWELLTGAQLWLLPRSVCRRHPVLPPVPTLCTSNITTNSNTNIISRAGLTTNSKKTASLFDESVIDCPSSWQTLLCPPAATR